MYTIPVLWWVPLTSQSLSGNCLNDAPHALPINPTHCLDIRFDHTIFSYFLCAIGPCHFNVKGLSQPKGISVRTQGYRLNRGKAIPLVWLCRFIFIYIFEVIFIWWLRQCLLSLAQGPIHPLEDNYLPWFQSTPPPSHWPTPGWRPRFFVVLVVLCRVFWPIFNRVAQPMRC